MKKEKNEVSAGILVYRIVDNEIQVLLGKNGGPRWKNKSVGAWNIPKGHVEDGENLLDKDKLQIKLRGSGIVILLMQVPEDEIIRCKLFNDKLIVDGEFAVLRSGSIDVSIESINNNFNHSDISEKEYLHVYEGIGEVWILPTLSCYEDFSEDINEKQEQ